jgi:hypothetical protein
LDFVATIAEVADSAVSWGGGMGVSGERAKVFSVHVRPDQAWNGVVKEPRKLLLKNWKTLHVTFILNTMQFFF